MIFVSLPYFPRSNTIFICLLQQEGKIWNDSKIKRDIISQWHYTKFTSKFKQIFFFFNKYEEYFKTFSNEIFIINGFKVSKMVKLNQICGSRIAWKVKQHWTKVECVRFKFCPKIAMEEENYTKKGIRSIVTFSFYSSSPPPPSSFQLLWRIALFLLRLTFYDRIRNGGYRISKYTVFGASNDATTWLRITRKYNMSE